MNFTPCVRRRHRSTSDSSVWIVVVLTRLKKQSAAIRARLSDAKRRLGSNTVSWTLPCGVFQFVEFAIALKCWSKLRMDELVDRAALDLSIQGRRLFIGGIHEDISGAELDEAITNMGYAIETATVVITKRWGSVAYVTMESNDDAVDFILRSDSCEVGNPPCQLVVKTARPRDPPAANYPPDDAFLLIDAQQSREHGAAHGLTDTQVATVVEKLQTLQESTLQTTVDKLTGSVTGLPVEFQQALNNRLSSIETAVQSSVTASKQSCAATMVLRDSVLVAAHEQHDRLQRMEEALLSLAAKMDRMAIAQEQSIFDAEWDWEDNTAAGDTQAAPEAYFQTQSPPDQPRAPTSSPVSPPPPHDAPARGGINMECLGPPPAQFQAQPPSDPAQPVDLVGSQRSVVLDEAIEPPTDMDTLDSFPLTVKRDRDDESSPDPVTTTQDTSEHDAKKRASTTAPPPEILTPTTTPAPTIASDNGSPMSILSIESAMLSPLLEIQPGYTVNTCGRFLAAWNTLCHEQPHLALHNGSTAEQLLRQALTAEERLRIVATATDREAYEGCKPSDACKGLAMAHSLIRDERAASEALGHPPIPLTSTEAISSAVTPF